MEIKSNRLKAFCAEADVGAGTARKYAALKLIDAWRDSNGNWIFGEHAAAQLRSIRAAYSNKRKAA